MDSVCSNLKIRIIDPLPKPKNVYWAKFKSLITHGFRETREKTPYGRTLKHLFQTVIWAYQTSQK